jgi:hypothetical protein
MKTFTLTAIAAAIVLAAPAAALAGMSKADYQTAKTTIEGDYKTNKAGCEPLAANAKDVCMVEAKGKERVALAELGAAYKPTEKARYDARLARADADYAVAKEKCDDKAGNPKDVCVKEAQAARTTAKADAKAHMKTVDAGKAAGKEVVEARKDAAADKRDAEYAVEKEKCDASAGSVKDACLADAKARYGKS